MASDLDGKLFLMTGATEGIGKAAALDLARRGAHLTLVGRNREKSERVIADLARASGNQRIELIFADLSTLAGTRAVAAAWKAQHQTLDVLVNNAGGLFQKHQLSSDGFEMTFALNHLSYFLLTHELLDVLQKTPGARVVSTSSGAHRTGRINFEQLAKRPSKQAGFAVYGDTKLANILFTKELARRLAATGGTANCFHPGFVATGFGQNNSRLVGSLIKIAGSVFARTPEKGAETLVWLATSPEAANSTGEYFHDKKIASTSAIAKNEELAKKLWDWSAALCGVA